MTSRFDNLIQGDEFDSKEKLLIDPEQLSCLSCTHHLYVLGRRIVVENFLCFLHSQQVSFCSSFVFDNWRYVSLTRRKAPQRSTMPVQLTVQQQHPNGTVSVQLYTRSKARNKRLESSALAVYDTVPFQRVSLPAVFFTRLPKCNLFEVLPHTSEHFLSSRTVLVLFPNKSSEGHLFGTKYDVLSPRCVLPQ